MAVKKLIEVALPLDAINAASAREKSIRHGHPSTLHLWWARRPLAAARAVIWASLVDDPSSHPEEFPTEEEQDAERKRLFKILEDLVVWENSNNLDALAKAKAEIRKSMGEEEITLLDPFAGGGAIPLEAQRLGLKAYAHDLNPVAVIINKAMIDIPARFAGVPAVNPESQRKKDLDSWDGSAGIATDVEYYGARLREEAFAQIGDLYPHVAIPESQGGGETTALAWIWTRTIECPNPACGCRTPLVRSFDLSRKKGNEWHVEPITNGKQLSFDVQRGRATRNGTVNRTGATCVFCGSPVDMSYIRSEARSGRMYEKLMAIIGEAKRGRIYVAPTVEQEKAAAIPEPEFVPETQLPEQALGFRVQAYGIESHKRLFTNRQLSALNSFCGLIEVISDEIEQDAISSGMDARGIGLADGGATAKAYAEAICIYLAFQIDKLADLNCALNAWEPIAQCPRHLFTRQAISMLWDHAEANVFSNSSGSWNVLLKGFSSSVLNGGFNFSRDFQGIAEQADAQRDCGLRNLLVSTDPPYYDNIGYADLSDFFYIWLRQSLRKIYPDLFATMLVPKEQELIATPFRNDRGRQGARDFFETGMLEAVKQIHTSANDSLPVSIFYAFKQSETESRNDVEKTASTGWETMLTAIIRAGFSVVGTWPIKTENASRMRGQGSNALASSIVLVCRKRSVDAPMATRRDFVNALKHDLKVALDKLQTSNIAPVDMAQSAIGPGIGVYSRFSKVLEADGTEMTVRSALQIINQELDLYFSDQDSDLDRESRFCVDLYTQNVFNEIRFGEADVLARAKNTSIEGIAAKGALSSAKGVVRLLGRDEIRDTPAPDFCWLFTQQLTHAMETGGIEACANLLKDIYDNRAENARALAYRLFTIADKKGWNQEAFAYNSLVVAWRDIESRAAQLKQETPEQTSFDF